MNNSGFNGTGTAFILYVALAFLMPLVHLYRIIKRRRNFAHTFIMGIFTLASLLSAIVLVMVGYVWRRLLHSNTGQVHEFIVVLTWLAVATLVAWVLIPQLIVMSYRLRRKSDVLKFTNPLIHPWLEMKVFRSHKRRLALDGLSKTKDPAKQAVGIAGIPVQ